jgi:hypothetical protein
MAGADSPLARRIVAILRGTHSEPLVLHLRPDATEFDAERWRCCREGCLSALVSDYAIRDFVDRAIATGCQDQVGALLDAIPRDSGGRSRTRGGDGGYPVPRLSQDLDRPFEPRRAPPE